MNKKNLIPPKLNKKFVLYGFTVPELGIGMGLLIFFIATKAYSVVFIPALYIASSFRFKEDMNFRDFVKRTYKYYFASQIFNLEGGEKNEKHNS